MPKPLRLVVGLGNPGASYEGTRHNAGFWFADALAQQKGARFVTDARSKGLLATVEHGGERVWLLKPQQFMNRSGEAVAALAGFYRLDATEILIVHDELDLDVGIVRLKVGGGHGGHNGLKDIVARLGGSGFARLRIGIGRPVVREDVTAYVLGRPSVGDRALIDRAVDQVILNSDDLLGGALEKLMNKVNRKS